VIVELLVGDHVNGTAAVLHSFFYFKPLPIDRRKRHKCSQCVLSETLSVCAFVIDAEA